MAGQNGRRVIKNAVFAFSFPIRDSAGALVVGATFSSTLVSKDGGSFASVTNPVLQIASASGVYNLTLSIPEMGADEIVVKATPTTGNPHVEVIRPERAMDSGNAQAATASSITLQVNANSNDDFYNGGSIEIVRGTGAGQVRTVTDYTGSSKLATVDRAWVTTPGVDSVYVIQPSVGMKMGTDIVAHSNLQQIVNNATAAALFETTYQGIAQSGTVDDVSATTTTFDGDSGLSANDDEYNDQFVVFTSGTLKSRARKILNYTGATKTVEVASAFSSAPANGDEFVIIGFVP